MLQIPAIGTDVHADLALSPSDEDTGDTGGRMSESTESSKGTCHYSDAIGSLLISVSCEDGLEGRNVRGFHYSRRCRKRGRRKI